MQIVNFSAGMTFKFNEWLRKTIGQMFYAMSSFVYHIKATHQWIQTGVIARKRSIRVKIGDFLARCELEIWQMIEKQ